MSKEEEVITARVRRSDIFEILTLGKAFYCLVGTWRLCLRTFSLTASPFFPLVPLDLQPRQRPRTRKATTARKYILRILKNSPLIVFMLHNYLELLSLLSE